MRTPLILSTMVARLVVAVMVVGSAVLLGLWANEGPTGIFAWMATAATTAVALLLSGALARLSVSVGAGRRFAAPLAVIQQHPVLKVLATDRAARWAAAAAFGLGVATLEGLVSASVFAGVGNDFLRGALSLGVVSLLAWTGVGLLTRPGAESFWSELGRAITRSVGLEVREMGRVGRAVAGALLRSLVTVGVRSIALLLLPVIFNSPYAIGFVALVAVTLITAGDVLRDLVAGIRKTVHVGGEGDGEESE